MSTIVLIIFGIACLGIIITTLMQETQDGGLNGLITGTSETFYSRNKTKTKEAFLKKLTIIFGVLFVASVVTLNLLYKSH